jgi:DNA-binding transcriptional ArsR family regulator
LPRAEISISNNSVSIPQASRSFSGTEPGRDRPKAARVSEQSRRFAYEGLERVIHEKARLSVLTSVVAHPSGLVFGDLKQMCSLTDGNLSRHLQVLEQAELIKAGRQRYLDYLKVLEQVVRDATTAATAAAAPVDRRSRKAN